MQEQIERLIPYETYHSFTNPIWFKQRNNVGVIDLEKENVLIYPNPTSSLVNVKWEGVQSFVITVYDQSGKRVMSKESNSNEAVIDLKSHVNGSYILELKSGNRKVRKWIVKSH